MMSTMELLTVGEVNARVRSYRDWHTLVGEGRAPAPWAVVDGTYRWRADEVDAFVAGRWDIYYQPPWGQAGARVWRRYAARNGLPVPEAMSKDDVIVTLLSVGVIYRDDEGRYRRTEGTV